MADPLLRVKLHESGGLALVRASHIASAQQVFTSSGKPYVEIATTGGRVFQADTSMKLFVAAAASPAADNTSVIDVPIPGRVHLGSADPGFQAPQHIMGPNAVGAHVDGGLGNDIVFAGTGADQVLSGGAGENVFVFLGPHTATIADFKLGQDRIDIGNWTKPQVTVTATAAGDAVVNFRQDHITLAGVTQADLMADLRPSLVTNSPALDQLLETPSGSVMTSLAATTAIPVLPPKELIG